jgi:CDP-glucose 4,6-dehydratase
VGIWESAVGELGVTDRSWFGESVLVTGAAGLLGGWVCRKLLDAGARVSAVDIDWSQTAVLGDDHAVQRLWVDVREREAVDRILRHNNVETIVHLAAQAVVGPANQDPVETLEHNVQGTWTLLDTCRRTGDVGSIVVASSDKAYGDYSGRPYEEDMPLMGRHPYAASKACADVLAQMYAESFGLPVAITRCANMYGGGDVEWSRLIPGTIRSVLQGERPVIRSDGRYVRNYLYVEDSAEGVLALARRVTERSELKGQPFNFGAEKHFSVLEVVHHILELMGSDLEPEIRNVAVNEIPEQRVNTMKARETLGWRPAHTLDEGLALTVDWYRAHLGTRVR